MRRIIILWHILILPILGYSQICGINDNIDIAQGAVVSIPIMVEQGDLVNENLADPGQGLCGIEIYFIHAYATGLELTLTSPGGQSIQLTGPSNLSMAPPATFGSRWNISFVPAAEAAQPDPGWTPRWNNFLNFPNFQFGGLYTGSYYPFAGNLEDFNTGATYGTWTLEADNTQALGQAAILSVRLIFCDQTGLDCCFAEAGSVLDDDLLVCEGDGNLNFVPDIEYPAPAPDPNIYGYTYVVSQDSILLFYDSTGVDLSGLPAATYQVCGLAYLRSDSLLLPQADGQYTLGQLYTDLGSLTPSFCADLTDDCREIIIQTPPAPVDLPGAICEGESFTYLDTAYTQAGVHSYILQTAAGCDSIVNIILSVIPTLTTNIDTTICAGETVQIGASVYAATGVYRDTLDAATGCDSIVVLDLGVLGLISTDLDTVICRGDSLIVGGQTFFNTTSTQIVMPSAIGCDSTINLDLTVLEPVISLAPVDTINCTDPNVTLDASGSMPAGQLTFAWEDLAGNALGASPTLTVTQAGDYRLLIIQEVAGVSCSVEQIINVPANAAYPVADAGLPQSINCTVSAVTLGGANTSTGSDYTYEWTTADGNFLTPVNIRDPRIDAPGTYTLVVTNTTSNCRDTSAVTIISDANLPLVNLLPDTSLTCDNPNILLTSTGSSTGNNFLYEWRDSSGAVLGTGENVNITAGGSYELLIRNTANNCRDSARVNVVADTLLPVFSIAAPPAINCENTSVRLTAAITTPDPDISPIWQASAGGVLAADANSFSPLVSAAGVYRLELVNSRNGCSSTAGVVVVDNRNVQNAEPAVPDILSCGVSSINLDAGNSSTGPNVIYQWSTNDGRFVGSSLGRIVPVNAPGAYTLTVLDTLSRCSDQATVTVQQDQDSPFAEAGPGFTINCQAGQDTLSGFGSSTGPGITYRWSGPCLLSDPADLLVLVDCPGTYYLEVTNTTNNCTVRDSVVVLRDEDLPAPAVVPVDTITCSRQEVVLDAGPSTPFDNLSFAWSGPGITGIVTGPTVSVSIAGDYQLTVTDTLSFCQQTLNVQVPFNTTFPSADAGPEVTLTCREPLVRIGGSNTSTGPDFSYQWLAVEGALAGAVDSSFATVDREGIYRLLVTDTRNGCRDSSTVVVTEQKELPGAHAGFDQEINCGTDEIELDGSSSVQQAGITYQWSGPCLTGPADSLFSRANCPGDYYLTVTNTISGCSVVDTVTITLNPAAPRAVLPDTAVIDCTDGTAILDGTASSNGFFEWTKDGAVITSGLERITVEDSGWYLLSVSNLDKSCVALDSILVISDCQPEIEIAPPARITCQSPTILLDAGNSFGQSLSYEWTAPDPSCIVAGQGTPVLEVSCGGSYTLTITNTTVGLSDTQTVVVQMDANIPQAVVGPPDTLTCVQTQALLDGSASSSGPNIIYRWTRVSNGAVIAQTASTVTSEPGTFTLEVIDTLSQCSATATVRIVQFNLPVSLNFGDNVIPCGQDTFALRALPTPLSDFYSYQWTGPAILDQADSAVVLIAATGVYSLTVTDNRSECQAAGSVTVTADLQCAPCVEIAAPDTLSCTQNSTELQAAFCRPCTGCVLQWTTADGRIIANGNTLQPTVDLPGTYRLAVIDLQGFETQAEVTVTADNSLPAANAGPDRFLTCDSTSVALGIPGPNPPAQWAFSWAALSSPATVISFSPVLNVSNPGAYVLEVRDVITGCSNTDSVSVSYDTIVPIADAGPDRLLTCTESFVILDGSGSNGEAGTLYTWSNSNPGSCLQGENAVNPIVTCAARYYLRVENAASGCFSIDSVLVSTDSDVPVLNPLPDTVFQCGVDSIVLQANVPDPDFFTGQWCALDVNGDTILNSCIEATDLTVFAAGYYLFTVINDTSGCRSSFVVQVDDARELPQVDAGPDLTFLCADDSLSLEAVIGPDPGLLEFRWISLGNLPIGDANSLTPTIYSADTLLLVVTNPQTSCSVQDTVLIGRDLNAPIADAGPDSSLTCLRTSIRLQGSGQAPNAGTLSYQWSTTDGNIQASANTPNPVINRAGTYLLTVRDPANNCTATDAVVITDLRQPPIAAVAGLDSLQFSCDIDSLLLDGSLSTSAGGALDYFWSVVATGTLTGDPTQSSIYATSIGTYRLVVTDRESGCRDSLQFTLTAAFGAPVIRIAPPDQLSCSRTEVTLDAATSEFGNGYTATWYDANGDTLLTDVLQLTVSEPGTYSLQIDNNNTGCSNLSDPVTVTIDTVAPQVAIAAPDLLDCTISSVRLDGSASSAGPMFQYEWTTANGLLLDAGNQAVATAGGPGLYNLAITNMQNGCRAEGVVVVEAITNPIVAIDWEVIPPSCTNEAGGAILAEVVAGGQAPFTYSLNQGLDLPQGNFTQLRAGLYTLTIRDANGCEWTEEITVPGVTPIDVDLGPDMQIQSGDSVQLIAQTSSNEIVLYQWEPTLGNVPNPVITPEVSTSYGLTVTDSNGCIATDRVLVQVVKERAYFLPTAFSPDGDGNNDHFMVMTGPEVVNIPIFRIYDRWGQLVYERLDVPPNDPTLGWDGRHNNLLMNPAVFVYYIELEYSDGWVEVVKGDVTLLR